MRKIVLIIYVCVFSSLAALAQTPEITFVQSIPGDVSTDTTYDSNGNPVLAVTVEKFMECELNDTTGIGFIRVKLGTEENGQDILNQNFAWAGQTISSDLYMQRIGLGCRFKLGSFTNRDFAYLTIEALSSGGAVITSWQGILN
ncbi:MAG: hypothetical protein R2850_07535 [Bacteroidia bacterium]